MSRTGSYSLTAPCGTEYPYLDMAASVLNKALMDWETYSVRDCDHVGDKNYVHLIHGLGFKSPCDELTTFFLCSEEDWLEVLLGGFSPETRLAYLRKLKGWGIPVVIGTEEGAGRIGSGGNGN